MDPRVLRLGACVLLGHYALVAGALLLTGDGWSVNRVNVLIWSHVTGALGVQHLITPEQFAVLANVVLFVPPFAALAVLRRTWWWVALGATLSTGVELLQATLGTRTADPGDVLMNSLGALLGTALGLGLSRLFPGRSDAAPAVATAAAIPRRPPPGSEHGPDGGADDRG